MKIVVISVLSVYLFFVLYNFIVLSIISTKCKRRFRAEYPALAQYKPPRSPIMKTLECAMPYFVPVLHAIIAYDLFFNWADMLECVYREFAETTLAEYEQTEEDG